MSIPNCFKHLHQTTFFVAFIGSALVAGLVEVVGSTDYEGSTRFDANWGAPYLLQPLEGSRRGAGIIRLLGVPVFDGTKGLGHRLPNFNSIPQASPLILASQWIPAHFLSLILVWISLALLTIAVQLTSRSWLPSNSNLHLTPALSMAAAPTFVYLLYNDWGLAVVGLVGSLTIATLLLHESLSRCSSEFDLTNKRSLVATLIMIVLVVQVSGHPRYLFLAIPIFIVLADRVVVVIQTIITSNYLFAAAFSLSSLLGLIVLEIRANNVLEIREVSVSILDYFDPTRSSPKDIENLILVSLANTFAPFLRIIDPDHPAWTSSRTEFQNFLLPLSLAITVVSLGWQTKLSLLARLALRAFVFGVTWMILGSSITQAVPSLKLLFLQDGWDLSYLTAFIGALGASISIQIYLASTGPKSRGAALSLRVVRFLYSCGSILALLFPIQLFFSAPALSHNQARRDWIVVGHESSESDKFRLSSRLMAGRTGMPQFWLTTNSNCPGRIWESYVGVSHPFVLANEGIAVLESDAAYRAQGLSIGPALEVPPDSLNFLGFQPLRVADENPCIDSKNAASSPPTTPQTMNPNQFHNFYVRKDVARANSALDCNVLSDCLGDTTKGTSSSESPPWRLCTADCWFNYNLISREVPEDSYLLLPARFDESIEVKTLIEATKKLPTFNYRGLLAVDLTDPQSATTLTIDVVPDSRQLRVALLPYIAFTSIIFSLISARQSLRPKPSTHT